MTRHRQMLRTSYFLHGLAMQHFPHGSGTLHADLRNPVQASSLSARLRYQPGESRTSKTTTCEFHDLPQTPGKVRMHRKPRLE